jgi:hypothetical protein
MPPIICSDDEVDRLLRSMDPVNRGALELDTVADARNALRDVVAREALVGHHAMVGIEEGRAFGCGVAAGVGLLCWRRA